MLFSKNHEGLRFGIRGSVQGRAGVDERCQQRQIAFDGA